ncbi:hypothetical protein [Massilia sp. IC2-476]|uniref:RIFT barrel domain-containing protein n=1 Tax=Massilia sp. IC2-476 TaxID=2887199 RepID=UPI001D107DD5|nr:hypothetical protein [Massilia sp. IC2-476]MCC2971661.1 hypothetical protein [Massilia sp. IC2-476]
MSAFRVPIMLAFLLAAGTAHAEIQVFTGLPAGGGLDARKVVEARYGSATPNLVKRIEGSLTTATVENTGGAAAGEAVPVSFGQVFAPGVLQPGTSLHGRTAAGTIPLQMDVKATHPDGSVRHAVISALVARPEARKPVALGLFAGAAPNAHTSAAPETERPAVDAVVSATIDGKRYSATLDRRPAQPPRDSWLAGPIAHEWHAAVPLRSAGGEEHPQLVARFALRTYPGARRTRVDITVENAWAFEPGARNFTYDAQIALDGAAVYTRPGLNHYHHTRWRKVFWVGGDPGVDVHPSMQDLMASRAIPNYDPTVLVAESALADMQARWHGPRTEPMGTGEALPAMGTTGGRADIGLLPGWAAMYLLSADARARKVTLGTGDLAGSFSAHFRDKRSGRPVSVRDFPYMTILGRPGDAINPATGKSEGFRGCETPGSCDSPNLHDVPHQPELAYLPYLVTGDHYYLEELQFWAMYNAFSSNPYYREFDKGLLKPDQVRGQAWGLRTLARAAYITPDDDPLKKHFRHIVDSNLAWYNAHYTDNPQANALGVVVDGYAVVYKNGTALAPWQDDFFTAAVGMTAELGFDKALPLLKWKARFPVARMVDPDACWIDGAIYDLKVRDSAGSPFYRNYAQAYRASHAPEFLALPCAGADMAAALKLAVGEMTGYSTSVVGYPSNMQPALAYSAAVAGDDGRKAWERFMARSVKPDYGNGPQFAIVPR